MNKVQSPSYQACRLVHLRARGDRRRGTRTETAKDNRAKYDLAAIWVRQDCPGNASSIRLFTDTAPRLIMAAVKAAGLILTRAACGWMYD
jgi:hypothetical protein